MNNDKTPVCLFEAPTTFRWAVRVPIPANNHYVFARFVAEFLYMSRERWDALTQQTDPALTGRQLAENVLVGVHELLAEDGKTHLPNAPELVARVLDVDRAIPAVIGTFEAAINGMAAEKN